MPIFNIIWTKSYKAILSSVIMLFIDLFSNTHYVSTKHCVPPVTSQSRLANMIYWEADLILGEGKRKREGVTQKICRLYDKFANTVDILLWNSFHCWL